MWWGLNGIGLLGPLKACSVLGSFLSGGRYLVLECCKDDIYNIRSSWLFLKKLKSFFTRTEVMTCCPEGTHKRIASRKTGAGETGFFILCQTQTKGSRKLIQQ